MDDDESECGRIKEYCIDDFQKCRNMCEEFGVVFYVLSTMVGVIVFVSGILSKNPYAIVIGSIFLLPIVYSCIKLLVKNIIKCCKRNQYQNLESHNSDNKNGELEVLV